MIVIKRLDNVVLKCECGRVVELYPDTPLRTLNRAVLCDGRVLDGRVKRFALFAKAQDEVAVDRGLWGLDTYTLYHLNEEIAKTLSLTESMNITLRESAKILRDLGNSSANIDGFVAFVKKHQRLSLEKACTLWRFMSNADFTLLRASQ
jgi:hypothetical protein